MIRKLGTACTVLVVSLALAAPERAHSQVARAEIADRGPFPTGIWYSPSDTAVPQLFSFVAIHADGTFTLSGTDETGGNPAIPGEFTPIVGLWSRGAGGVFRFRGFAIRELETPAGSELAVTRLVLELGKLGHDDLAGAFDIDFLPCAGPFECPDPDADPLRIGEGVTGGLPFELRRIARDSVP